MLLTRGYAFSESRSELTYSCHYQREWVEKFTAAHFHEPQIFRFRFVFDSRVISPNKILSITEEEVSLSKPKINLHHTYIQCVHKRMVQFQTLTRNLFLILHG
jgi:hypothetical protein